MSTPAEISDLVHRYCDAVVRKDRNQWAATWATDSHWDLGRGRVINGKAAIVDYWIGAVDAFDVIVQLAHNGEAIVDGDRGTGRWYISEHTQRRDGSRGLLLAYYDDTYSCVDNEWLFAGRAVTVLYRGAGNPSGNFAPVGISSTLPLL